MLNYTYYKKHPTSVHQSGSSSRFVLPGWWQDGNSSVVSCQSVDSRFDQNQSEFSILVLSVSFQVLSNRDSLSDQVVQVFWDLWGQTVRLQDSHDLVTSDETSLSDTVSISQQDTDLRWSQTLSGVLDDLFNNRLRRQFEPTWWTSGIWNSGRRDTLTLLKLEGSVSNNSNLHAALHRRPQFILR